MVPLLVVLTILSFVVVDAIVQKFEARVKVKKPAFNPATDVLVFNGQLSMADGGEPIEEPVKPKEDGAE